MSSEGFVFTATNLNVEHAIEAFDLNGIIVIRKGVSQHVTDQLQLRMRQEAQSLIARDFANFTRFQADALGSPGHLGFLPPLSDIFIDRSVLLPDVIAAITSSILEADFYLHEWVVNLNLAGNNSEQKAHRDESLDSLHRRSGAIMHIATQTLGRNNGMTLFWVGSHKWPFDQRCDPTGSSIPFQALQPELLPGDIVIRDLALLHKGVPNRDLVDRYLPALVFNPGWHDNDSRVSRPLARETFSELDAEMKRLLRKHPVISNPALNSIPYPIG